MGVGMPEMDGFDALERIRTEAPGVKVILMSAYENPSYVSRAAALGAADFLWKDAPTEAFVDAIHRAARGEEPPTDSLISQVRANLQSRPDPSLDGVALTKRECEVLHHLAHGLKRACVSTAGFDFNAPVVPKIPDPGHGCVGTKLCACNESFSFSLLIP
jgi:DNA-binding NarL/FixJ family response regulator